MDDGVRMLLGGLAAVALVCLVGVIVGVVR